VEDTVHADHRGRAILSMMVVVGIAQDLVSRDGTISPGALIAVSVPGRGR
jgi:hypothetical protein